VSQFADRAELKCPDLSQESMPIDTAYIDILNKLQQRTGLPFASLPCIAIIDSMQGHALDIAYLNQVNLYNGTLGFLEDNRRINVPLIACRTLLSETFHLWLS
jgi:hypothetical protein